MLGAQVWQGQLKALLESPFYAIMIDERTDISVIKEMVIYARYIDSTSAVRSSNCFP